MLLVGGVAETLRRRSEGPVLVAVGAAGLFVIFGLLSWGYLGASQLPVSVPGGVARATVVVSLGVGAALATLPLVRWLRANAVDGRPVVTG